MKPYYNLFNFVNNLLRKEELQSFDVSEWRLPVVCHIMLVGIVKDAYI